MNRDGLVTKSEVIDLINPMNVCQPWADHPTGTYWAAGAFIDTSLHICGGKAPDEDYSINCFFITPTSVEGSALLTMGSRISAATQLNGSLWYTGGYSRYFSRINKTVVISQFSLIVADYDEVVSDGGRLQRTEIISKDNLVGPDLPYPVDGHCIVKLTEESFYLLGGTTHTSDK